MHINIDYIPGIMPIFPSGTNSTMFTECCGTAICADEMCCPSCGRKIIGWDAENESDRRNIRWKNATRGWNRKRRALTP